MKLTYEQEKALRRMKAIQREVGILAIVLWIFTIIVMVVFPMKLVDWFMVPIGAIALTISFLYTARLIRKVEKQIN